MTEANKQKMTPASIVVAGVLIALAIVYTHMTPKPVGTGGGATNDNTPTENVVVDAKKINAVNEPFIGDINAPVIIAYWSDYQCPFCKQFETATMPQVISTYVETNKARIIFKDFQFLGPDSTAAALVARAVWEKYPEQYFPWREAIFASQDGENTGFGDMESVMGVTETISGIDRAAITDLVTAKKNEYQKRIDADKVEAGKYGIKGTPGFVVGTQVVAGAVPWSSFKETVDTELGAD